MHLLGLGLPASLENVSMRQLLEEGLVTILIDDVVLADQRRQPILQDFISKYSRNRFMYTTTLDSTLPIVAGDEVIAQAASQVSFSRVFLKPFTRSNMRSLVAKWDPSGKLNREIILDRLSQEFAGINIPTTAAYAFRPINRATLIERFVEYLLEKSSLREAARGTFDFTNKVHVLANLAEHMAAADQYVLTEEETLSVVQTYLKGVGLVQNASVLVSTFVNSRVLVTRPDGGISFRYRAFLEYFVACQMRFNTRFKSWVLDEERYLSFANEIGHYAGIARDDIALLELMGERFAPIALKKSGSK